MIVTVDPADDRVMRAVFDVGTRAGAVGRPWFRPGTYESWALGVREEEPGERSELYAALGDDGEVVGSSRLYVYLSDNVDKLALDVYVDPRARRRGHGGALADHAVARGVELGRSLILTTPQLPGATAEDIQSHPTVRFARAHGFEPDEVEIARHLDLPVADALLDDLDPVLDGYRVETFVGVLPEEHLAGLGELMGLLGVDAPTGAIEFEPEVFTPERMRTMFDIERRRGRTRLTTLALADDGGVAAETDLVVENDDPTLPVYQYGTFVHREHRGHRLGTAVKVANLRALQREFPGRPFVVTENAETNRYMVDINKALGFRVVEVTPWLVRRI